jgi:hypothetical protein
MSPFLGYGYKISWVTESYRRLRQQLAKEAELLGMSDMSVRFALCHDRQGMAVVGARNIARASLYRKDQACSPSHAAAQYRFLVALAAEPAAAALGAAVILAEVRACSATMAFITSCISDWTPANHQQHARVVKARVCVTMLCAARCKWNVANEIWGAIFNGGATLL